MLKRKRKSTAIRDTVSLRLMATVSPDSIYQPNKNLIKAYRDHSSFGNTNLIFFSLVINVVTIINVILAFEIGAQLFLNFISVVKF